LRYWKQHAFSSRYVEHFIARIQVGKIDQADKIRENLWTDPVIDRGSLAEHRSLSRFSIPLSSLLRPSHRNKSNIVVAGVALNDKEIPAFEVLITNREAEKSVIYAEATRFVEGKS
jgi:hypothetical protein